MNEGEEIHSNRLKKKNWFGYRTEGGYQITSLVENITFGEFTCKEKEAGTGIVSGTLCSMRKKVRLKERQRKF